jgi:transcriptional accessory protein Tex/SPT6
MRSIEAVIAAELAVGVRQVEAAVRLLDEGATVPFVARYRKEITGGLDDTHLRALEKRLGYLRELAQRRDVIRKSLTEQGQLTPMLAAAIDAADTQTRLEDLYRPFKPKRRGSGTPGGALARQPRVGAGAGSGALCQRRARRRRRRRGSRRRSPDPHRGPGR